jgi:membrane associated rhomboid family serine protease
MLITYGLIAFTVFISFYAWKKESVIRDLIMNPYVVKRHQQYYRFLSSGFIHQDHMHLLMNMISLYFFGSAIEGLFRAYFGTTGSVYYICLYILGIVVSDIPTYFKHWNNPSYNALGASGGVAAIIFAFILFLPLEKICLYFALCFPGFILGTAYIIYSYYQGRKANDNINHDAHLYGALFGLLFCIAIHPPVIVHFFEQIAAFVGEYI